MTRNAAQIALFDLPEPEPVVVDAALPSTMKALIERGVSLETVNAFMDECGGWEVTIPRTPKAHHVLVRRIGMEAALEIARVAGGDHLTVPRGHAARIALRNEAINKQYRDGVTVNDLASKHALSARQVWAILGEERR